MAAVGFISWSRKEVCAISECTSRICLHLCIRWKSDQLLWSSNPEIQVIPKGSHTFFTFLCSVLFSVWHWLKDLQDQRCMKVPDLPYTASAYKPCEDSCANSAVSVEALGTLRGNKDFLSSGAVWLTLCLYLQVLLEILSGIPPACENREPQFLVSGTKEAFTARHHSSNSLRLRLIWG